ncbi:Hypothetical predicted protein [Olea europaea subsp. europaea]|uniref:Uncharacterized protein n=1 Tax=Olea europaea subsp. europaea TaxID=158383 RepID=A0A8S0UJ84_OLEEU|nr:Hypothetical predicted protein [Olea europaea subsp. europaea]
MYVKGIWGFTTTPHVGRNYHAIDSSIYREEICTTYVDKLDAVGDLLTVVGLMHSLCKKHIFFGPCTYERLLDAAAGEKIIILTWSSKFSWCFVTL